MSTIYKNGVNYGGTIFLAGSGVTAGIITAYGGNSAPTGWLMCDGSAVSREIYSQLFSAIGTTYGSGDGSTTFNVPDLRGRVAIGAGTGTASDATAHSLGDYDGEEKHTLIEDELPNITGSFQIRRIYNANNHIIPGTPTGHFKRTDSSVKIRPAAYESSSTADVAEDTVTYAFGNNGAHDIMQPYLTINYIISIGQQNGGFTHIIESDGNYSGGIEDEYTMSTDTIEKWETLLNN